MNYINLRLLNYFYPWINGKMPLKLKLQFIIYQVEDVIRTFSAFNAYDLIDVTENTVKIKIYAQKDLYVQVYANFAKDKLNLTLIQGNECIYGEDSEGGTLHIHPFNRIFNSGAC